MKEVTLRRPRKRKPTITPRFGSSTIALEISLIRMAIEVQREELKKENR
jgi:hypothetical protein